MKFFKMSFILLLICRAALAQDTSTVATFKIRKPEARKPVGAVFTTGESRSFRSVRNNQGTNPIKKIRNEKGTAKANYDYVVKKTTSIEILDLEYPPAAIDSAIKGVVVVSYELGDIGSPANIEILEAAHWLLNGAAVNFVRNLPAKSPKVFQEVQKELRRGRITVFTLPITFSLE